MYGYVYKITNKTNNKIYIGQHKSDHFDESYFGGGVVITNAVNKYGKENFDREILEWCATKEELDAREIHWIQKLNSRNPEIGHNISEGGEHGLAGCVKVEKDNESLIIPKDQLKLFLMLGYKESTKARQREKIDSLPSIARLNTLLYKKIGKK